MTTQTIILGNAEISRHISTARTQWASGSQARFELGEIFSKLRASIEKYNKDEDKGISYNEAVRLTGVPRGTAEHYRHMYEICDTNDIPNDAFTILAEAGFTLATDVHKELTVEGLLVDNPELKSVEHLLSLSEDETEKLIKQLRKDYGKPEAQDETIESIRTEIAELKQTQASLPESVRKAAEKVIVERTSTLRNKMLWVLRNIAQSFAPLLGKDDKWVETYLERFKQGGKVTSIVEQAYSEAVKFAQSATFLTAQKKPAASAKKSAGQATKKA